VVPPETPGLAARVPQQCGIERNDHRPRQRGVTEPGLQALSGIFTIRKLWRFPLTEVPQHL